MRDGEGRKVIVPQRRAATTITTDMGLLRKVGAEVDLLLVVHGAIERWRGAITRTATTGSASIAMRPFGAATTEIEFLPEQCRDCVLFEARGSVRASIEQIQALRCGRRSTGR